MFQTSENQQLVVQVARILRLAASFSLILSLCVIDLTMRMAMAFVALASMTAMKMRGCVVFLLFFSRHSCVRMRNHYHQMVGEEAYNCQECDATSKHGE